MRELFPAAASVAAPLVVLAALIAATANAAHAAIDDDAGSERARVAAVRASAARANDPVEIDALVREAATFADADAQIDARMLAAHAYLGRLAMPARGRALLRLVANDARADAITVAEAANALVRSDLDEGLIEQARADAGVDGARIAPALRERVATLGRRRVIRTGAWLGVLLPVLALGVRIRASHRTRLVTGALRRFLPTTLMFGAAVALAGGGLAAAYADERASAAPFLALGAAVVPALLTARAWSAAGATTSSARAARAGACAAMVVAAAFLVLERVDPSYLDGFGL